MSPTTPAPAGAATPDADALARLLIRNLDAQPLSHSALAPRYGCGMANLTEGTAARQLGARLLVVPPGMRACPYHLHHAQEEMFIVLAGEGTLRVAGQLLPVRAGDVITIPAGPAYPHQLINSAKAELRYLAVGTTQVPEICEYPDSGKFLAESNQGGQQTFDMIGRLQDGVDYWEGER